MPLRSCIVCRAEKSLQYCAVCQSALYCSEACQKIDWRNQHKKMCKFLNVGHGDMQFRTPTHTRRSIDFKLQFEREEESMHDHMKRFFKLFEESTFEGSQTAARKMRKIATRETNKHNQKFLLFHSLYLLARSDSEMLSWPNSPLFVMLQLCGPNVLTGDDDGPLQENEDRVTPLHDVADLADPSDYSTHKHQLILAKQLIEHGANVNAVTKNEGKTPLHMACSGNNVTNLDFVEILLEGGADPNIQDYSGETALMCTIPEIPGAAKFLLNWPTTDVNITTPKGESFLVLVRFAITTCSNQTPGDPDQIKRQFLLEQWCDIEEMLVQRGP
jgi:hypothetical protein